MIRQSVVVTGSGKGIGRAIAERLSSLGWIVVGLERSPGSGTVDAGICRSVVLGDSSDLESHRRAAAEAIRQAPLAGWVNNAGVTKQSPLHAVDEKTVREVLAINGLGYIWGCAAAVETFVAQRSGGAIVNIGSIHGRASFPHHAAYEFTKGGIDALARSVAVSYGPFGIRANTLAPGGVLTPHLQSQIAAASDPVAEERSLSEGPPLRRIARPSEIADAAAFLLSEESSYITGQSIAADGGWSVAFGSPDLDTELSHRYGIVP